MLLLEGKPFRFEVDGDETDGDEFGEGLLGEGQDGEDFLSTSTLEILIEHFSSSSDGLNGGADGPAFENDPQAPLFDVVLGEGEEHARDAFAPPSLQEA